MKHTKSVLITAPSGAGKTTLVKKLLEEYSIFEFSISCTTRPKREHEVHGKDYHFITEDEFISRVNRGEFLEWEEVYKGSYYGTLHSELDKIFSLGKVPLFDIDIMGAMSVKKILSSDLLSIFIAPPSMEILEKRLRDRHTEPEEKIKTRIDKAHSEMRFANFFDKKIVNDDLDLAYSELRNYIHQFLNCH